MRPCACFAATADELARHPRVVGVGELESRERVLAVGVEAGRDEDELRAMALERRQPVVASPRRETPRCRRRPGAGC